MHNIQQYKIYSTPACVHCKLLKDWLNHHQIKYQEIDLSINLAEGEEMIRKTGQMGVPVSIITFSDKREEIILGFDQARLGTVLGIQS